MYTYSLGVAKIKLVETEITEINYRIYPASDCLRI